MENNIKKMYETVIHALHTGETKGLENIVTDSIDLHFSTVGHCIGKSNVKAMFEKQRGFLNYIRISYTDCVALRSDTGNVILSNLEVSAGMLEGKEFYPVQYGAKLFVSCNEIGMIDRIKLDLDWIKGNTDFFQLWTFLDHNLYGGHKRCICFETDIPVLPENSIPSDILHYVLHAMDMGDYKSASQFMSANFHYSDDENIEAFSVADVIWKLKNQYKHECTQHNSIRLVSEKDQGELHVIHAYRYEPHRIRSKVFNNITKETNIYNADVDAVFKNENGCWKLCDLHIVPHIVILSEEDKYCMDECEVYETVMR